MPTIEEVHPTTPVLEARPIPLVQVLTIMTDIFALGALLWLDIPTRKVLGGCLMIVALSWFGVPLIVAMIMAALPERRQVPR